MHMHGKLSRKMQRNIKKKAKLRGLTAVRAHRPFARFALEVFSIEILGNIVFFLAVSMVVNIPIRIIVSYDFMILS
jgi:hypothetical protein